MAGSQPGTWKGSGLRQELARQAGVEGGGREEGQAERLWFVEESGHQISSHQADLWRLTFWEATQLRRGLRPIQELSKWLLNSRTLTTMLLQPWHSGLSHLSYIQARDSGLSF